MMSGCLHVLYISGARFCESWNYQPQCTHGFFFFFLKKVPIGAGMRDFLLIVGPKHRTFGVADFSIEYSEMA